MAIDGKITRQFKRALKRIPSGIVRLMIIKDDGTAADITDLITSKTPAIWEFQIKGYDGRWYPFQRKSVKVKT